MSLFSFYAIHNFESFFEVSFLPFRFSLQKSRLEMHFFLVQNDLLTCLLQLGLKKDVQLLVLHYRPRCGKFIVPLAGLVLCSCLSVPAQPCAFSTLSWGHRIRAGKKKSVGGRAAAAGGAYFICQQLYMNPLYCRIKSDREA